MLASIIFYSLLFLTVAVVPAGLILVFLLFLDHQHQLWRAMTRVGSPLTLLAKSPAAIRVAVTFPRTVGFLGGRLNPSDPWGLPATVASIGVAVGMWLFLGVLQDILAKDPLVIFNVRLHNSVPLFRTTGMTWFMVALTQLGSTAVLGIICAGSAIFALGQNRPRLAATFVLAGLSAGVLTALLKVLVGHARPLDALIDVQAASFPSGHLLGGTVVYGLLAALLLRSKLPRAVRVSGTVLLLLLIVGIGISRLYLGVHWPSDLLGSLAVALVLVSALLFFLQFGRPIQWLDRFRLPFSLGVAQAIGVILIPIAFGAGALLASQTILIPVEPPSPRQPIALAAMQEGLPADLARFSEDFIGGQMEPISLVFVGSQNELERAFSHAGWTRADHPTPVRVMQEVLAAIAHRSDASAPATPAFLADWPQSITFEKPDAQHADIRTRHHTRVWQTRYCVAADCRPVWVATASFDVGVGLSRRLYLPTHRIDPAIDSERAVVVSDLTGAGATAVGTIRAVAEMRGKNAAGDPFWTDGNAVVLLLP